MNKNECILQYIRFILMLFSLQYLHIRSYVFLGKDGDIEYENIEKKNGDIETGTSKKRGHRKRQHRN